MPSQEMRISSRNAVWYPVVLSCLGLTGAFAVSRYQYGLFHSLIEMAAASVFLAAFYFSMSSRRYEDGYVTFLGGTCLGIGMIQLMHALAYPGLQVLPGGGRNLTNQLWIVARGWFALSLAIAPAFLGKSIRGRVTLWLVMALTAGFLFLVFSGHFPESFSENKGMTTFKVVMEYVICALFLIGAAGAWKNRAVLAPDVYRFLLLSIGASFLAEIAFTRYVLFTDFVNFLGHCLLAISAFFFYRAIVHVGVERPQDLVFRQLALSARDAHGRVSHLQQIIDSVPYGLNIADASGRLVRVNRASARILGFGDFQDYQRSLPEFIGIFELRHLDGRMMRMDEWPLTRVVRGESLSGYEVEARHLMDGWSKILVHDGAPIRDDEGRITHAIVTFRDVTERKEIENKLLLNEAKLKAVLDNAPVGLFVADRNGDLEYLNRAGQELWGGFKQVGASDYREYRGWRVDTGKRLESHDWALAKALQTGETVPAQRVRIESFDGNEKFILNAAGPIHGKGGELLGGVAVTQDISDLILAEQRLRESEERLTIAKDASEVGIHDYDLLSGIVRVDATVRSLWGADPEEPFSFDFFLSGIHPEDRESSMAIIERACDPAGKGKYHVEYRVINRKDRTERWISDMGRVSFEQGRVVRAVGTVQDITERRRIEAALRESEARFRQLAEAIPQMVWTANPDGKIDYYNQRWFQFTGLAPEEAMGDAWTALVHPDDRERISEAWSHAVTLGVNYEIEVRFRRAADQVHRWILVRALPIRDEQGRVVKWFGTNTDIHEQKQIATELEEAVKARDEFLSIASHELKTPLSSLKIQAQLMKRNIQRGASDAFAPDKVIRLVDQTDRQVSRLARLVDDMLDVSRIESGRLVIQPETAFFGEIVQEVVERLKPQMLITGNEPVFERMDRIEGAWDRFRMEQVVTNLMTNAMRYGKGTPVRIRVERSGGSTLRMSVQDQGMGISKEDQERIFDRFERAVPKTEISGLGLGLFVSREIVKLHGGQIRVESELGQGATFIVELPVKSA